MRRWFALAAKAFSGFFLLLDVASWITVELDSSPLNSYNIVGYVQRLPFWIAYLVWVLWPIVSGRVGLAEKKAPDEPPLTEPTAVWRRSDTEAYTREASDDERATWIQQRDEPTGQ